ncbi:MAG: cysteine desulfurase-like protein [Actinomycetes bacterium]
MTSLHGEDGEVVDVTIEAVLDRFHSLNVPMAYFDGPAGTQVPDSVLEAVSGYLLACNANVGGKFLTSMVTDDVVAAARAAASDLLGVFNDEVTFGANMTSLNFALSRTASRDWQAGDEVVVTRLDHDANVAPWLEIAHDKGIVVKLANLDDECRIDLDHLRSLVTEKTKVVAFPWASNAVGTITPVDEIITIAHDAGALAWVDAVHYAPHGDIEIPDVGCDVLLCSPYKFFGPHLGLAWVRRDLSESWRPYKVRPQSNEPGRRHETGTLPHELLCGFVACVEYLHGVGWKFINEHERALGQRFLDGIPDGWTLHGPPTMEGRVSTFALTPPDETPEEAAARIGAAGFAVWHGNNHAVEVFEHLGLPDGAVRVGIVHTNTAEQVDRLLAALPRT